MNIRGSKPNSQHVLGLLICFRKFLPYSSRDVFHVPPPSYSETLHFSVFCFAGRKGVQFSTHRGSLVPVCWQTHLDDDDKGAGKDNKDDQDVTVPH